MPFCLKESAPRSTIDKYHFALYTLFLAGFFFLPTKLLRNYYYLCVMLPFLAGALRGLYRDILSSRVLLLCGAYCLYMVASLGWGDGIGSEEVFYYTRRAVSVLCFLAVTTHFFSSKWDRLEHLLKYLSWTAGVMAVVSSVWYGCLAHDYFSSGLRMINLGILDYPNSAGCAYALIAVIAFFKCTDFDELSPASRVIYPLVLLVSVTFIILTQSRGSLIALVVVLLAGVLLLKPGKILWVLGLFLLSYAAAALFGGFRLSSLTERADSFRLTIWRQGWEMFKDKPILGHGLGGDRPPIVFEHGIATGSHNLFLSNMVDGGILALLFLLSFLLLALYWALRSFSVAGKVNLFTLIAFSISANIVEGKILIVSPNYQWLIFWLPIGLIAAHEVRSRKAADLSR